MGQTVPRPEKASLAGNMNVGTCKERKDELHVVTWNVAAVNRNPFEYHITHDSAEYATLMQAVEKFIEEPGKKKKEEEKTVSEVETFIEEPGKKKKKEDKEETVSEVFKPEMLKELEGLLRKHLKEQDKIEKAAGWFNKNVGSRSIVTGFLKDTSIGEKRLISMPDRVTNTMTGSTDELHFRPTVINGYDLPLDSTEVWWKLWKEFMFDTKITDQSGRTETPCGRLDKISSAKYREVTAEESEMSIPLQIMCLAAFDAVLVHMMNVVAPESWHKQKTELMHIFSVSGKTKRTVEIIQSYITAVSPDVFCLQEVAEGSFKQLETLNSDYKLFTPENYSRKNDQNSVILLNKIYGHVQDRTKEVIQYAEDPKGFADGDVCVMEAIRGKKKAKNSFVFVSFHGDTNGLRTLPLVNAVNAWKKKNAPLARLVIGLDANAFHKHVDGKKQGIANFNSNLESVGLKSCFPEGAFNTTFTARTYLQPQLNKAVRLAERETKGDRNPRDHVVVENERYTLKQALRDNRGNPLGQYDERLVLPTVTFPSDHAIVYATFSEGRAR